MVSSGFADRSVPRLLDALRWIESALDTHTTLSRICEAAADLTYARYAAMGVVAEDREGLVDFVHHGVDADTARRIGRLPDGRAGLLGALIHDPEPLLLEDLTTDPRSCGFPPHHPPMRTFLGLPVRVGGDVFGNLYLAEKHGGVPFDEQDLALVRVLSTQAGTAIGNARLYEGARRRERWIDGAVAVTTALLSVRRTDDALQIVAEQARRLAGAEAGIVLLTTEGSGEGHPLGPVTDTRPASRTGAGGGSGARAGLEVAALATAARDEGGAGEPDGAARRITGGGLGGRRGYEGLGVRLPMDSEGVGEVLGGAPMFVADAVTDVRLVDGLGGASGPVMVLPLRSDSDVLGVLVLVRARNARQFTESERAPAVRFAAQAALALRVAQAQRDRERLAVLEGRARVARDLHDVVIQRLFAAGMALEDVRRRSAVPEVRDGVGKAVGELDVTIAEIRDAVFALRHEGDEVPSVLSERVLREIGTAAVALGFRPAHRFAGPVDTAVGEPVAMNLVAALREALSNACRHAQASRIEVVVDASATLSGGRRGVRLTVADDGVGIPEGGRRSGLSNLRRRAESLGGYSGHGPGLGERGGGTTVTWEAPLGSVDI